MSPVRVLVVEDNPDDAELVVLRLQEAGYVLDWERVCTPEGFLEALGRREWELILSDFKMPRFTALEALTLLRERELDLPFILVSGSVGEEVAVEAMRAGAHDFFPKAQLTRLPAAVERELREAQVRRERRQAMARLREAEQAGRLIVESLRDRALFLLTPQGRVASWNRGAERLTGWTEAEVLGAPVDRFYPEEARARGEPAADLARALAEQGVREEGWRLRRDGSRFWADWSLEAIDDASGARGFTVVLRDASERKRLLDDLREAVRVRDEFLSIASHELRTPLTSLLLHAQSLQRQVHAPRERREGMMAEQLEAKLGVIVRQVHRLTQLVQTLLDVTRLSSGQLALVREPVDLRDVVVGMVSEWSELAARAQVPLRLSASTPVEGVFDRLRLESVLAQLLSNAVKYGPGQPVDVRLTAVDGRAVLEVEDRGIGIPLEEQQRIFGRFQRAVPDAHYGGFGLGLWIARQVVEAHGGTIRVRSEPGVGSTFTVELPLVPPPERQGIS